MYGGDEVRSKKKRLNEIFCTSENAWEKNLERIKDVEIEYLLIGEAPPWSDPGQIIYFYETFDNSDIGRPTTWIRGLWKSLIGKPPVLDVEENLKQLAKRKFLLIDSLPLSMPYTTKIRDTDEYKKLVSQCDTYFLSKIKHNDIRWSENLKVAIAFYHNGKALIEKYAGGVSLPNGFNIDLTDSIAASGNGFPTMKTLSKIWCLKR